MTFSNKIPSLDGLRAVSILLVLVSHVTHSQDQPSVLASLILMFQLGGLGVTVFFVISGFLITTLLLREKAKYQGRVDIKSFYVRRVLRIFPVFYLYVAAVYGLKEWGYAQATQQDFIRALTYTANLGIASWALGHAWTLAVEEQFYLFWPWLVRLSKKIMVVAAIFIIIYASMAREIGYRWPFLDGYLLLPFLRGMDCLMVGALAGILLHSRPDFYQSHFFKSNWIRFGCFLIMLIFRYMAYNGFMVPGEFMGKFVRPFGDTVSSLCLAYLLVSFITVQDDIFFKFLNHPVMIHIGVLSYSLYVWQQIFLDDTTSMPVWWRSFPVSLVCTFCAAGLSYYFWERPILKWRDRFKRV